MPNLEPDSFTSCKGSLDINTCFTNITITTNPSNGEYLHHAVCIAGLNRNPTAMSSMLAKPLHAHSSISLEQSLNALQSDFNKCMDIRKEQHNRTDEKLTHLLEIVNHWMPTKDPPFA